MGQKFNYAQIRFAVTPYFIIIFFSSFVFFLPNRRSHQRKCSAMNHASCWDRRQGVVGIIERLAEIPGTLHSQDALDLILSVCPLHWCVAAKSSSVSFPSCWPLNGGSNQTNGREEGSFAPIKGANQIAMFPRNPSDATGSLLCSQDQDVFYAMAAMWRLPISFSLNLLEVTRARTRVRERQRTPPAF